MNVITKIDGENKAVYCVLDARIGEEICDFGAFSLTSRDLAAHLRGCKRVILFAATIGATIDREILKQSRLSPHRALALQQEGTARIETWCNSLCAELENSIGSRLRRRYSPGYGDLALEVQREVFRVLGPASRIGLCLSDSCVMTPTKSVTAFLGVEE